MIDNITTQFIYKNKQISTYGLDTPENCMLGKTWWHNYPVQNFVYSFNSQGFRSSEIDTRKKVFIALGDSFTMNLGGPIENSWPSILSKYLNMPVINLGVNGIGNDAIYKLYKLAHEKFDVVGTFVMYSFLHRRLTNNKTKITAHSHEENVEYFINNRLSDAIECVLPQYTQSLEEQEFFQDNDIYSYKSKYITNYTSIYRKKRLHYVDETSYNSLKGKSWCSYAEFINGGPEHEDMFDERFNKFITLLPDYTNRDGFHMNYNLNKTYAEHMYNTWIKK